MKMIVKDLVNILIGLDPEADVTTEIEYERGTFSAEIGSVKIKDNGKTIILSDED